MLFQYTYDTKGNPVGVFVPINEWTKITAKLKQTKLHSNKKEVLKSVETGIMQVRDIEKGKLKSVSLKELLNAL